VRTWPTVGLPVGADAARAVAWLAVVAAGSSRPVVHRGHKGPLGTWHVSENPDWGRGTDEPGARCAKVRGGHRFTEPALFSPGMGAAQGPPAVRSPEYSNRSPVCAGRERDHLRDHPQGLAAYPLSGPPDRTSEPVTGRMDPEHDVRHTVMIGGNRTAGFALARWRWVGQGSGRFVSLAGGW
jgi:hypothetical protein